MLALFVLRSTKNVENNSEGAGYASVPRTHPLTFRDAGPEISSPTLALPYQIANRKRTCCRGKMWKEIGKERGYASVACENCGFSYQNQAEKEPKGTLEVEIPKVGTAFLFSRCRRTELLFSHSNKKGNLASGLKCCGMSGATSGLQVSPSGNSQHPGREAKYVRTLRLHGAVIPPRCAPRRLLFCCRSLLLIAEAKSYSSARTHPLTFRDAAPQI